jgi:hypothetical protein
LKFLDIPTSFYKFWKFELILEILLNQKKKKNGIRHWAGVSAQGHSARRGVGWWPGPTVAAAYRVRAQARWGAVTAARADAMARVATAHRWINCRRVKGKSTRAVGGVR